MIPNHLIQLSVGDELGIDRQHERVTEQFISAPLLQHRQSLQLPVDDGDILVIKLLLGLLLPLIVLLCFGLCIIWVLFLFLFPLFTLLLSFFLSSFLFCC